jgi:hypothetical protein
VLNDNRYSRWNNCSKRREYSRKYYSENAISINKSINIWKKNNPDKVKAYFKKSYEKRKIVKQLFSPKIPFYSKEDEEIIRELRLKGVGYHRIGVILGKGSDTIRRYCKKNGL